MSAPKILKLTNKATGQVELVNPFRVNRWTLVPPPTAQPYLAGKLGTLVSYTNRDWIIVVETVAEIERMILGLKTRRPRKTETSGQMAFAIQA